MPVRTDHERGEHRAAQAVTDRVQHHEVEPRSCRRSRSSPHRPRRPVRAARRWSPPPPRTTMAAEGTIASPRPGPCPGDGAAGAVGRCTGAGQQQRSGGQAQLGDQELDLVVPPVQGHRHDAEPVRLLGDRHPYVPAVLTLSAIATAEVNARPAIDPSSDAAFGSLPCIRTSGCGVNTTCE